MGVTTGTWVIRSLARPSATGQRIASRRSLSPRVGDEPPPEFAHAGTGLDEVGETGVDGFRPLGGVPDHDERPHEDRALFLHAPESDTMRRACRARPRKV